MTERVAPLEAPAMPAGERFRAPLPSWRYFAGTYVIHLLRLPIFALLAWLLYGFRTEGRHNLKKLGRRGCIVVANHSLYVEPVVLSTTLLPRLLLYSAQLSHFNNRAFGAFLRWLGTFPITRREGRERAETLMRAGLDRGRLIVFFPEGKLTHLGQTLLPFRKGAFHYAQQFGVPVLPVTLVHRPRKLFGRELSRRFVRVKCIVGQPVEIDPRDRDVERAASRVHRIMSRTIAAEHARWR